jgi:hypothetical protein
MSKKEKLLSKAVNHPEGLSIDEFRALMRQHKWVLDHQSGSHYGIRLSFFGFLYKTEMEKQRVIKCGSFC